MRRTRGWKVWTEPSGDTWRCRWSGKYGRGQQTFLFKKDADELTEKKKRNFQRLDAGLPPIKERAAAVQLSDWARRYLLERSKNPRQNTYIKDKEALDHFLEWALKEHGDTDLESISIADIYAWKDWLYEDKEYSHATVRMRLAHLRPALKWAQQRGLVTQNVGAGLEMPKPTYPGRVLTMDEIQKIYGIPPRNVVRAFVVLLNSGMRKGEVVSLLKSQVEQLVAPEIWRAHFGGGQTKNSKPKAVVFHPVAQAAIAEAMAASKSDKVFDITKDVLDYWMRKVQEVVGEVRLHDFKHTFCTYWMRATGDLYGLQQMTGNSLSSLRIYQHLALGTPRGLANFPGMAPLGPLNATVPTDGGIKKDVLI